MIKETIFSTFKNQDIATQAMADYEAKMQEFRSGVLASVDPSADQLANHEKLVAEFRLVTAKRGMERKFQSHFNDEPSTRVPARAIAKSSTCFSDNQAAYDSGQWIRATLLGDQGAREHCVDRGLIKSAMGGNNDLRGGVLVPVPIENAIIELREQFGVGRTNFQMVSMGSDSMLVPRMSAELTSYYVSENTAITPSDMSLSQVTLTSKKLATLTVVSSELNEDSIISVAEMLARSVAQSFAVQEDSAGFLGAGGVLHGSIIGLDNALAAGSVYTSTGRATFGALTLADFESTVGRAKLWAGSRPKWYISNAGYCASMLRLQNAAGGNNRQDLGSGLAPQFMGYPVVLTQVLPSALTGTTGTTAMFFGDLMQGVFFGTRRGVTIATDPSRYFELDAIGVRATQRFDIVVHDRGDASNAGGIIKVLFG